MERPECQYLGIFGALHFRYIPLPDELNRYMLIVIVTNLSKGRYEILADGRAVGTFTDQQLAAGLKIASATAEGWEPGGPRDAEAGILIHLTEARSQLAEAARSLDQYLPNHPERTALHAKGREIDERIETLQRTLLKPRPFHFVIRTAAK